MTLSEAFNLLGLKRGCSTEEVKKAYRYLAKKNHPDVVGVSNSNKFILINDAYALVLDKGMQSNCKLTHTSIFKFNRN